MTATFLILGHSAKEIKLWPQLVVLMGKTGKDSLKRRVQSYEPDTMPWDVAEACQEILAGMDTGSVADVSAGAAAFYIWVSAEIYTVDFMEKDLNARFLVKRFNGRRSSEEPMSD